MPPNTAQSTLGSEPLVQDRDFSRSSTSPAGLKLESPRGALEDRLQSRPGKQNAGGDGARVWVGLKAARRF